MKRFTLNRALAALCAAAMFLLAGCQPTPESEAVTSKNDGALAAALQTTAAPAETADDTLGGTYTSSFTTTDGGTEYTVSLAVPAADAALPVLRVTPEAFSAETVEQFARAFFDDENIYEYSTQKTKAELEEEILALKQQQAELAARTDIDTTDDLEETQIQLEEYEAEYESAPETAEKVLCDFQYHSHSYYESDYSNYNGWDTEQAIECTGQRNGLTYQLGSSYYQSGDMVIAHMGASPLEEAALQTLYDAAGTEPTEADIAAAEQEVQTLLDAMGLGDWAMSSEVSTSTTDGVTAFYLIEITVVPAYNGVAMTQHPYVEDMEDSYASQYDMPEITVRFTGGEIESFSYQNPVSVVEVTNENVQTLSFDEIMEKFQTNMSLRDSSYYTTHVIDNYFFFETGRAEVTVDRVVLGMGFIHVQDSATDYYILPTYTFYGSVAMFDDAGNQLPYYEYESEGGDETGTVGAMETELAILNAVDGSVIDTSVGY